MSELNLVCLHFEESSLLPRIIKSLDQLLSVSVNLGKIEPNLDQFYNADRLQYDAAGIIARFENNNQKGKTIILTSMDLYIPIFTFVFGLAKLNGGAGIVSTHRLKNEIYGLPENEGQLVERILKEIIHELGHLLNLRHCPNFKCVMASANTVDNLDIKEKYFCKHCTQYIYKF